MNYQVRFDKGKIKTEGYINTIFGMYFKSYVFFLEYTFDMSWGITVLV